MKCGCAERAGINDPGGRRLRVDDVASPSGTTLTKNEAWNAGTVGPDATDTWFAGTSARSTSGRRPGAGSDPDRVHDELLKKIGELTIERDFLARGLRRSR